MEGGREGGTGARRRLLPPIFATGNLGQVIPSLFFTASLLTHSESSLEEGLSTGRLI